MKTLLTTAFIFTYNLINAQFTKNFGVYIGYAIFNEPTLTFEYKVHPRIGLNLEGAAYIPYLSTMSWSGMAPEFVARLNCTGGGIRPGISIYGKKHFGIMHRVSLDFTYISSGLYKEEFAVQFMTKDNFYRKFMQYGIFYELTFRPGKQKRSHLFIRAGIALRTIHRITVAKEDPNFGYYNTHIDDFSLTGAPILSLGYRFRVYPAKYFLKEE